LTDPKDDDAATDLLIKEVDEDLRHEQMTQLWKRHGGLLTALAMCVVLAVAGWQGWNAWDSKQRQAVSGRFGEASALVEQGKKEEAADLLTRLTAEGTKGYRLLARLRLADLRLREGDVAAAAALYQGIAGDSSVDRPYRDMAAVRAGYLTLETADQAQLDKAMEPLAVESSSWRHSAREIQALIALRRGDGARASDLFAKIAEDGAAPQGLRARAAEMLAATAPRSRS